MFRPISRYVCEPCGRAPGHGGIHLLFAAVDVAAVGQDRLRCPEKGILYRRPGCQRAGS